MERRSWPWWAIGLAWLGWGLFYASRHRLIIPEVDWPTALSYALPDALIWALWTPVVVWLARRLPIARATAIRHLALHLLAAAVIAVGHSLADAAIHDAVAFAFSAPQPMLSLFNKLFHYGFHTNFTLYFVVVGLTHYFDHLERLRERERQTVELRARLSESQLDSLRKQLRPHFLFNALHTISGLMESDPQTARRLVRKLGDLLRMSLKSDRHHELTLREELEFVEAYLDIEQARFRDRLTTRIDADADALDSLVPAFVLQPLVENAVRHGIAHREADGRIDITARCSDGRVELQVTDNGPGLADPTAPGGGIGIANTRARLTALYDGAHRFELTHAPGGGLRVTIGLPRRSAGTAA